MAVNICLGRSASLRCSRSVAAAGGATAATPAAARDKQRAAACEKSFFGTAGAVIEPKRSNRVVVGRCVHSFSRERGYFRRQILPFLLLICNVVLAARVKNVTDSS